MNDKTLVERLIEAKPISCADFARMFNIECQEQKDCIACKHIVCCSIANAIEGEYIPRPRYEDGEPVQFGDAYTDKYGREWKNGIKSLHIDCNGNFSLHSYALGSGGQFEEFNPNERVKRPKPEVLDADGVPIKVGDELWNLCNGMKVIVDGLRDDGFYSSIGGDYIRNPRVFSHKQPDSLKRIEEDATMQPRKYVAERRHDVGLMDDEECTRWMCTDLLRRQRKILENK